MGTVRWSLSLCVLGIVAAPCRGIDQCLDGITFNVILLDDEESPWSLKFVKEEILKAVETDKSIHATEGNKIYITKELLYITDLKSECIIVQ